MKAFFRDKGKYKDGRRRVVIAYPVGRDLKSKALPKPEKLLLILDRLKLDKTSIQNIKENGHKPSVP